MINKKNKDLRNKYQESKLREISFPLGGLGTGCIGLSGNGRLIDWEIFNKPNKGSVNGFSHFSVKAEKSKKNGIHVYHLNIGQPDIKSPDISIKATTTDQLGFIGLEQGISAQAVCLVKLI